MILGETCFDRHHSRFDRDNVSEVWPNFAFPRAPLGIRHADAEPLLGDANNAILFTVGRPYRRISIDGQGSWTEWIEVCPDVLAEMVREYEPREIATDAAPFRFGGAPIPAAAYLAHRRIRVRLAREHPGDALELEEIALSIAGDLLASAFALLGFQRRGERAQGERMERGIVFDVQALLNRRLASPLGLAEISDSVDVSPYHLCRIFRKRTGVPIHRYRDWLRLRASLERIAEKDARMVDVAFDLGYANEAHFSDAFRRAFGMRPSAFRQSLA